MPNSSPTNFGENSREFVIVRSRDEHGKIVSTRVELDSPPTDALLVELRDAIAEVFSRHPGAEIVDIGFQHESSDRTITVDDLRRGGASSFDIANFDGQVAANLSIREVEDLPE